MEGGDGGLGGPCLFPRSLFSPTHVQFSSLVTNQNKIPLCTEKKKTRKKEAKQRGKERTQGGLFCV